MVVVDPGEVDDDLVRDMPTERLRAAQKLVNGIHNEGEEPREPCLSDLHTAIMLRAY